MAKSYKGGNNMTNILDVAQYIFSEYKKISGKTIDEMKLHKLLYLTQREALAITGQPMFSEKFEGWKYGPVCRKVREHYTEDGIFSNSLQELSLENAYIAKNVILQYGAYASWKLSEFSHKELSWCNSRKGIPEGQNGSVEILLEDIRKDAQKIRPYDSIWDMYYDEFEDSEVLQLIGKAYISITPFYNSQTRQLSFKNRPVLIIGQADTNDYIILPISRITNHLNIDSCYDVPIAPTDMPLMNLRQLSYIRTHKQCTVHSRSLIREITDFYSNYEDVYLEILCKVEQFQKSIINNAL